MKEIQVLGPGCPKCNKLAENADKAVSELGLDCAVKKITDIEAITGYGIMFTPGLVVDGEVKSSGKVLTVDQIKKIISE